MAFVQSEIALSLVLYAESKYSTILLQYGDVWEQVPSAKRITMKCIL